MEKEQQKERRMRRSSPHIMRKTAAHGSNPSDYSVNNDEERGPKERKKAPIPKLAHGDIRIIPLGGVEEIGKNMTAIEFGDEIIVVDIGVQFPDEQTPGVDYIVPGTSYLEERKSMVKGVVITHGHLDHIGGIPFVIGKIGNPPIYTTLLTAVMIKKRQEEFPHLPKLAIEVVAAGESLRIGKSFSLSFFGTTHTIPDTIGVIMHTPYGDIVITGDIKIDHKNGTPEPNEVETYGKIGKEKNLLLIADSTNVEKPGFSYSERDVHINLHKILSEATGRLIVGTFASLLERIIFIIKDAEEMGKKIVVEGRSMKTNVEIAKELGLLSIRRGTIIPAEEMQNYPDNKIIVLATGAQGDEYAALMRIANRQHKTVKLKRGDVILLSSSVIPGNEKAVQKLKDNLARQGAKIIHNNIADVHSSGHSYGGELEWVHSMVQAHFFIPVHGHHHMLRVHADMAERLGMPDKNIIVPDNGSVIEITDGGKRIIKRKENASAGIVMLDSLGTGDVKDVVIRDRQMLSEEGIFMIVAIINLKTGKVRKSPDIISRGFVYLKESQDLLRKVRFLVKKTIESATERQHPINFDYVRNEVRESVGRLLFQETHKRPIILPVLIEV